VQQKLRKIIPIFLWGMPFKRVMEKIVEKERHKQVPEVVSVQS